MQKSEFIATLKMKEVLAVAGPASPHGHNWPELGPAVTIMQDKCSPVCHRPPPARCTPSVQLLWASETVLMALPCE